MKSDAQMQDGGAVASKDGLGTLKRFAVAIATDIILEGKHWYSNDQDWTGMNLYFINAPDEETAEALGAQKALKHRREETPGAKVSIQATDSKEVPNDQAHPTAAGGTGGAQKGL